MPLEEKRFKQSGGESEEALCNVIDHFFDRHCPSLLNQRLDLSGRFGWAATRPLLDATTGFGLATRAGASAAVAFFYRAWSWAKLLDHSGRINGVGNRNGAFYHMRGVRWAKSC